MEKKIDKRLEPFIGNDSNHIGYNGSFKSADFLMSTERLSEMMESFSKHIQEANSYATNERESINDEKRVDEKS